MNFEMKSPCKQCPFRTDIPGYLTPGRAAQIAASLLDKDEPFPCHKSLEYDDEGEAIRDPMTELHCAGATIFLWKQGMPNQLMRIMGRLGAFKPDELDMEAPVVGTREEFIARMEGRR